MNISENLVHELALSMKDRHRDENMTLSYNEFLDLTKENPRQYIRDAAEYLVDVFDFYKSDDNANNDFNLPRYSIFDEKGEYGVPIVGGEQVQNEIYSIFSSFKRQGRSSKLLLLHGPNGSAKSSTVDTIAQAMGRYSNEDEGAVYRFNWIFPLDRQATPTGRGESAPIGFSVGSDEQQKNAGSYAHLEDSKIASRITSEFKENPLFLLPMPHREAWLRNAIASKEGCSPEQVILPPHILKAGLSNRNQQIFETLLNAYHGDFEMVMKHIQVERFFYSKQYRVGVSVVEPRMSVDANEKQLTLDKNISNLPSVLQTISFYQAGGELVEANRGILEFSDFLKRPVEAFKYLLNTVETGSISLPSGSALLDLVYVATTNEKQLDSFKAMPDFSSFKGRMELVKVPYLLRADLEMKIYENDIKQIEQMKKVTPHSLWVICSWAVMTRLQKPNPDNYSKDHKSVIANLGPFLKAMLYENAPLHHYVGRKEAHSLMELRKKIMDETRFGVVYEGRFGVSPREVKSILNRLAQNKLNKSITPVSVFKELREITKDRTVYEFLQFEPRGKYHDVPHFIDLLEDEFVRIFKDEIASAMSLAEAGEYEKLLTRYVDHVVSNIKKEKLWDPATDSFITPSENLMKEVEAIFAIKKSASDFRQELIRRIAAYKLENPNQELDVVDVLDDLLTKIKDHFHQKKKEKVERNYKSMLMLAQGNSKDLAEEDRSLAEESFKKLDLEFGYDRDSAVECLRFIINKK